MKKTAILLALFLCHSIAFSQWPIYFPQDTISFELNTLPYSISPIMGNQWEVGSPQKTFFNAPWTPDNAIVTGLQNPYSPTSQSFFMIRMPLFYFMDSSMSWPLMSTFLSFRHKYDTDTLLDVCVVDVSYDNGLTYIPLTDTIITGAPPFGFSMLGWEQGLASPWGWNNPQNQVSGYSGDWVHSIYIWKWYMPIKHVPLPSQNPAIAFGDSINIRFSFYADNIQNNKEGWMIDEIITGWADLGGSSRPVAPSPSLFQVGPNPASDVIRLIRSEGATGRGGDCVVLTDVQGKVVFSEIMDGGQILDIPCGNLPSGLYFCRLTADDGRTMTQKVQVLH